MSTDQTSTGPRLRPRFSLLTLLLLMTIVALIVAVWRLGGEVVPLREELRHLRNLTGALTIGDPQRLHAIRAQTAEPDFWRWRIYVPPTPTYYLHIKPEKVPKLGTPDRPLSRSGTPLLPGEHFMELKFFPVEGEQNQLTARFVWHGVDHVGHTTYTLQERDQQWINNEMTGGRTDGWAETLLATESVSLHEPLVLLRLRANDYYVVERDAEGNPIHSGVRVFDQPCDGLLVWIDAQER